MTKKPRFDLARIQAARILASQSCVTKANHFLMMSDREARDYIEALVRSLLPADFVEPVVIRPKSGRAMHADVYGKQDVIGLWYVKLSYMAGQAIAEVLSCHEAEHDLIRADGKVLRRKR